MRQLAATARLQFHKEFTLADATALVVRSETKVTR